MAERAQPSSIVTDHSTGYAEQLFGQHLQLDCLSFSLRKYTPAPAQQVTRNKVVGRQQSKAVANKHTS